MSRGDGYVQGLGTSRGYPLPCDLSQRDRETQVCEDVTFSLLLLIAVTNVKVKVILKF